MIFLVLPVACMFTVIRRLSKHVIYSAQADGMNVNGLG